MRMTKHRKMLKNISSSSCSEFDAASASSATSWLRDRTVRRDGLPHDSILLCDVHPAFELRHYWRCAAPSLALCAESPWPAAHACLPWPATLLMPPCQLSQRSMRQCFTT